MSEHRPVIEMAEILLFGDSITQQSFGNETGPGWGSMLASLYQRRADVKNRGYSGYNTRWARRLLAADFPLTRRNPAGPRRLATIFFGANDAALPGPNMRQHVPEREYAENITAIIARVQQWADHTIVITPPPVCPLKLAASVKLWGSREVDRNNVTTGKYAAAARRAAEQAGVACVDTFTEMQRQGEDWSKFLSDGLHLSVEGNAFLFRLIDRTIAQKFPNFHTIRAQNGGISSASTSRLPQRAPWHDQFEVEEDLDVLLPVESTIN